MKTRFTWLSIVATCFLIIATLFVGCNKDGLDEIVVYSGQVVYINTTKPFADLTVKVTNGNDTHCQTQTDAGGLFSLKVRVSEIDGNYYLLAGDSTCIPKKVTLGGYGQAEVDLGVIEVEGPALPTVKTTPLKEVTAESAALGGEVTSDGRLKVTARGICYGTKTYPTIEGLHTTDGTGIGVFSSTLKNLEHNTIYYARAYATNSLGTAYDTVQVKFTTELGVPVVITDSVYRITAHSAKCKGHVVSDGGYAVTKKGTCWSKQPDPTVDDECTNDGSGKGEFTSTLSNLVENTTYYVRTYATNETATIYGEQIILTTLDGLPVVKTDSVNNISATGFTAFGTVVSDCDIPVNARGFCYSTSQYPTIEDEISMIGKGLGSYQGNIKKLKVGTIYYVRAYAINETGTVYGEQKKVETLNGLPIVQTNQAVSLSTTSISVSGEISSNGGFEVTERGFCYSTNSSEPTIEDSKVQSGKGNGKFNITITNLAIGTTYHIRAYAVNENGIAYGDCIDIATKDGMAQITLDTISDITALTASASITLKDAGGATIEKCGICWSMNANPTIRDSVEIATGKQLNSPYICNLSNLSPNTLYYVKGFVTTDVATTYSEQIIFRTITGLPVIATKTATSTSSTITVSGEVTDNGGYSVTERGVCYSETNSEPTITDAKIASGSGNGTFNVSITTLEAATTYYIRAYATNSIGTSYGDVVPVITKDGSASVLLSEVSNITALTASASVTVIDDGGAPIQECGICWSINPTPTTSDNYTKASGKMLNTTYACNMSELQPNTAYYIRGYATTDITTTYSEEQIFSTSSGLPIISTIFIGGNVTETTALSGGVITDDGGFVIMERGVCWNTIPYPTIFDYKTIDGNGKGNYSSTITGIDLMGSNTYYVRAYATNQNGTVYGNEVIVNNQNIVYKGLPRLDIDGYIYVFYDDIGDMFYADALQTVEKMVFAGYDDWMLVPTVEQMRYIMEGKVLEGWKDGWGNPIIVYTKENPAPSENVKGSGYYWTSDKCSDGFYNTVQITCEECYNWDTNTKYYAHIAQPSCTQVSSNSMRVRPVRRYSKYDGDSGNTQGNEDKSYYIKHSWGSGLDSDWSWKKMSINGNKYTYTGAWGGIGANINTSADDIGAIWIPLESIENGNNWNIGDQVTFIYDPITNRLSTH